MGRQDPGVINLLGNIDPAGRITSGQLLVPHFFATTVYKYEKLRPYNAHSFFEILHFVRHVWHLL